MGIEQIIGGVFLVLAGSTGTKLVEHLFARATGRASRRRDEVDRAWRAADRESSHRRRLEEHASRLRRIITEAPCLSSDVLPPWPARTDTGPIDTKKEKTND